jgi:hypothetical protein
VTEQITGAPLHTSYSKASDDKPCLEVSAEPNSVCTIAKAVLSEGLPTLLGKQKASKEPTKIKSEIFPSPVSSSPVPASEHNPMLDYTQRPKEKIPLVFDRLKQILWKFGTWIYNGRSHSKIKSEIFPRPVSLSPVPASEHNPMLDYTQRSKELKEKITLVFDRLKQILWESDTWRYDGRSHYNLCRVDEYRLIETCIREMPLNQKDFYLLDIGGGDFSWSQSIEKFLDEKSDLRPDVTIHIIGTRGEDDKKTPQIEQTKRCKIYNLQAFKAEEISEQLEKNGLFLQNSVDLVISDACFRHLADPVGTYQQVYNLIRPKTGFFIFEGFTFALEGQESSTESFGSSSLATVNLNQMLLDTKAPFLTQRWGGANNTFIVRRPNDTCCHLPMSYTQKLRIFKGEGGNASGIVTEFRRKDQPEDRPFVRPWGVDNLFGDRQLYEWLEKRQLLLEPGYTKWVAL